MLNGLDLFSGYGGAQDTFRGLIRTIAYCEIEQGAQRILLRRMRKGQIDSAPIWDDVRTLRRRNIAAKIDIITGGFPCQDVSSAGMRVGLAGKRSGLFFEIIRLMGEFRPTFVYLENVTGLFTRGFDRASAELAAAGYDCRWGVLSAYDMGAAHTRERVWVLAHASCESKNIRQSKERIKNLQPLWNGNQGDASNPNSHRGRTQPISGQKCESPTIIRNDGTTEDVTYSIGLRSQRFEWSEQEYASFIRLLRDPRGEIEPTVRRGSYGPSDRRHRIRALGNGWVPQTAREAFNRLIGFKL